MGGPQDVSIVPDEPNERPDDKRKKNPFDEFFEGFGIDPAEFDRMFQEVHKRLQDLLKQGGFEPGKPYVQGFSFKVGPDGRPHFSEFGNRPRVAVKGGAQGAMKVGISDEREPLTDVIEGDKEVSVTLEIPGVQKSDIHLEAGEESLEVSVDTERRKYHKVVRLPCRVRPDSTRATYNNGILDVALKKMEGGTAKGFKVKVD